MADAAPHDSKQITLTFPDGATRKVEAGTSGLERGQGHLAVAGQAHGGDEPRRQARRPRRSHHQGRGDQVRRAHRPGSPGADPARCRARHGGSRAGAVAEDAGDDRPRHRERLLLRLRQAGAVPPRRSRQDRKEDGRDHRQERAVHEGVLEPQAGEGFLPRARRELQGRAGRRHPRGPGAEDLQAGRMARPVPRPAHDVDGRGRQGVQAAEDRRRLLARRSQPRRCCSGSTAPPGPPRTSSRTTCTGWRKPRSATTASSAARWTCSISRRRRRARCSGTPRAGRCSRRSSPTCAAASTRPATTRSTLPT